MKPPPATTFYKRRRSRCSPVLGAQERRQDFMQNDVDRGVLALAVALIVNGVAVDIVD